MTLWLMDAQQTQTLAFDQTVQPEYRRTSAQDGVPGPDSLTSVSTVDCNLSRLVVCTAGPRLETFCERRR
jgi:hypothetical protein